MRVLHPVRAQEAQLDAGTLIRPDGGGESWQVHALPAGRVAVRVEGDGPALWHLVLDATGRPERLQARLREGARTIEATLTFFEDEVLIWRRGAEPGSQSIVLPPGTRLLWPPIAGRDRCLAGLAAGTPVAAADVDSAGAEPDREPDLEPGHEPDLEPDHAGRDAAMFLLVRRRPADKGGLSARLAKLTVLPRPGGLALHSPGLPEMTMALDAAGRLAGWTENGAARVHRTAAEGTGA